MHIGMLCGGRFVNRPYIKFGNLKKQIKTNPYKGEPP